MRAKALPTFLAVICYCKVFNFAANILELPYFAGGFAYFEDVRICAKQISSGGIETRMTRMKSFKLTGTQRTITGSVLAATCLAFVFSTQVSVVEQNDLTSLDTSFLPIVEIAGKNGRG